jgi:hypothetical protein
METVGTVKVVGKINLDQFSKPKIKPVIKKAEPKPVITYPQEEIHFFTGKDKRVVGRSTTGKIAIISFDFKVSWVKEGEDWLCDVIQEDDHKIIVMPVNRTVSAEENAQQSAQAIMKLQDQGFNKTFTRPKNSIPYYIDK